MTHLFSVGVFLNIQLGTIAEIETQVNHIRGLKNVGHIEIWREARELEAGVTEAIQKLGSEYKLIMHAPFIGLAFANHAEVAEASLKVLQYFYNWGLEIGAQVYTIHAGVKPFYQKAGADIELVVKYLSQLQVKPSLKPVLEHMPVSKNFTTAPVSVVSLEELEQAVNALPNFGFNVDIGHVIQNEENWEDWMTQNLDRVYDIHFHDAFLGGKAHLPLGTADFKCMEFFEFLDKHHYKNFLSLEVIGLKAISDSWEYLQEKGLIS